MILYERITFLLVAGTLGLFALALVFGVWGAILTLYPELGKAIKSSLSSFIGSAGAAYAWIRDAAGQAYGSLSRGRLQARG